MSRNLTFLSVCSHPELALQGVPVRQRLGYPVPDELREVRSQHGVRPVLPAAGRLPGHPRHRMERRQLGPGEGQ